VLYGNNHDLWHSKDSKVLDDEVMPYRVKNLLNVKANQL
jgi:hypothetical protein